VLSGGLGACLALAACAAPDSASVPPLRMHGSSLAFERVVESSTPAQTTGRPGPAVPDPSRPSQPAQPAPPATTGPTLGGAAGGPGGEPPAPDAPRYGWVRLAVPGAEGPPIAGAQVTAHGGDGAPLTVVTDADGAFALPTEAGTELSLVAPGHTPCVLVGWTSGPLTLHLAHPYQPAAPVGAMVPVRGTVKRADGLPAAGVLVSGGDGAHTSFGPFTTDAQGRFSGMASSTTGPAPADMAVFALSVAAKGAVTGFAYQSGAAVGEGAAPITLTLQAPSGRVAIAPPASAGRLTGALSAVAENGQAVTLRSWTGETAMAPGQYFDVPGVRLEASVALSTDDGRRQTEWRQAVTGPGTLNVSFLPFPEPPALPDGFSPALTRLSWAAVAGATGYRVTLRQAGAPAPLWEGYTPIPAIRLHALPAEAPEELEITAFAGVGWREIASVEAPRRLRLPLDLAPGRQATVAVPLSP
jgi:hypothetical protein